MRDNALSLFLTLMILSLLIYIHLFSFPPPKKKSPDNVFNFTDMMSAIALFKNSFYCFSHEYRVVLF